MMNNDTDIHARAQEFWDRQSAPKRFLLVAAGALVGLVLMYIATLL